MCITAVCGDADTKRVKVKGVLTGTTQRISRGREIGTIMWRLRGSVARKGVKMHAKGVLNRKK